MVFVEPADMSSRKSPNAAPSASNGPETPPLESVPDQQFRETWLKLDEVKERSTGADEVEIESLIVERLITRHTAWIDAGKKD